MPIDFKWTDKVNGKDKCNAEDVNVLAKAIKDLDESKLDEDKLSELSVPIITSPDEKGNTLELTDLADGVYVLDGKFIAIRGGGFATKYLEFEKDIVRIELDVDTGHYNLYKHNLKESNVTRYTFKLSSRFVLISVIGSADEFYDPESSNAQSGIAVARAIAEAVPGYPFIKLSDCNNLYVASTNTQPASLTSTGTITTENANYMVTDFMPVQFGEKYIIKYYNTYGAATTTFRICTYNSSKVFQKAESMNRIYAGTFYHAFEVPEKVAYIRLQFRKTDENIAICKTQNLVVNKSQMLLYNHNSYTQGVCVSDEYAFVSCSLSKGNDPDDYIIKQVDLQTGEILAVSEQTYKHANGMTYNNKTDKILVCALEGSATLTTSVSDLDYSLYVVNPYSFDIEDTINLKEIVLGVCNQSVGICGVAYNSVYDEYYVLTRYPKRYIITLDSSFNLKSYFYMFDYDLDSGTRGDICTDGKLIYSTNWRSDLAVQTTNEIYVYSRQGELVGVFSVNGYTHIEGMDIKDGSYYLNFIDLKDSVKPAKLFKTNGIFNLT